MGALERHLLGTMFDTTRVVERTLSTGTLVRLRIEEIEGGEVVVHEAFRRRAGGSWVRWRDVEGRQSRERIRLDQFTEVPEGGATT